ncbi:hypothetical protein EVAR_57214_1 [Eumeta japonica]|uniref:Uncharacterized protein n=1 Tax=Eumeta variegata TaxID=151549 RepID=A0A4C1YH32_EUMVA|nr:hypothetical protein EVAR_57214_1 [Eumeta japonica]
MSGQTKKHQTRMTAEKSVTPNFFGLLDAGVSQSGDAPRPPGSGGMLERHLTRTLTARAPDKPSRQFVYWP